MIKERNDMQCLVIYKQDISRVPLLTKDEEYELGTKILAGDKEAVDALVNANLRLVIFLAKAKFKLVSGIELEDLIQEGNIGLFEAAQRFDPRKGFKFSTYAARYINKNIMKGIRTQSHRVIIPEYTYLILTRIKKVREKLMKNKGTVSVDDLSKEMGISKSKLENYMEFFKLLFEEESYDRPISDEKDAPSVGECYISTVGLPEVDAIWGLLKDDVNDVLDMYLNTEERAIVHLYYREELTYEMIGRHVGCSAEKVASKMYRIKKKLKPILHDRGLEDYLVA